MSSDIDFAQYERKYTGWERMKSFCYHCYILTIGAIIQPKKSKQYIEVFDEFIKQKKN